MKFLNGIVLKKANCTVMHILEHALYNPFSVCGRNWRDILCCEFNAKSIYDDWYGSVLNSENDKVNVIKEMIGVREGYIPCDILTKEDASYIVDDLCIE